MVVVYKMSVIVLKTHNPNVSNVKMFLNILIILISTNNNGTKIEPFNRGSSKIKQYSLIPGPSHSAHGALDTAVDCARAGRIHTGSPVSYLSVDDLVAAQRARLTEAFPANFTDEGARAGVHRHVARQVVVRVKHLPQTKNREEQG